MIAPKNNKMLTLTVAQWNLKILTGKPERSAYFLAGLNEGGASTLLSV